MVEVDYGFRVEDSKLHEDLKEHGVLSKASCRFGM
jgi:hypothetical protein